MMTKREFAEALSEVIAERNNELDIDVRRVVKMNDTEMFGLAFKEIGKNAAPTLYVDNAYEQYLEGESIENLATAIEEAATNAGAVPPDMEDKILGIDKSEDNIGMRLIGTSLNKEYLEDKMHIDFDNGLSLVFTIDFDNEYACVITKSFADGSGYDEEMLMKKACENAKPKLTDMTEALFSPIPRNLLEEDDVRSDASMLVLTNESGAFGAATLFADGVAEKIFDVVGGNAYYLLPSSVHEFIVVPNNPGINVKDLKDMVCNANKTVVSHSDLLSDSVFMYDGTGIAEVA